jgi:hypothetical protein
MMTGALLGGAPVQQAARLQMVIMFMIAAASALAAIIVTVCSLMIIVDGEHRVRPSRIDPREHWVWRARGRATHWVAERVKGVVRELRVKFGGKRDGEGENGIANGDSERQRLVQ